MESKHDSDSEIENNNELLQQLLAQDILNLVLSCSTNNQVFDRDLDENKVYENDVNQAIDDVAVMEVKDDLKTVLEDECRVLEQENGVYGWSDDGNDRDYPLDLTDYDDGWDGEDWGTENRAVDWGTENPPGEGEGGSVNVNVNVSYNDDDDDGNLKSFHYPLRPDAEDCSYYIRTGMCKYGTNCKFNHPLKNRNQPTREIRKPRDDNNQPAQIECKYYLSTGGCKYGKACKFNHGGKGKTAVTPVLEYNFLGLPIRPGEKECPYYMRNGSCKYGSSCRFNHPDPTAVGGNDSHSPSTYGNDGRVPLQKTSKPNVTNMPSWSASRTPDPPAAFVPMMYPQTQNIPPPSSDWNTYQVPVPAATHVYPSSERGLPVPPAFFLNNPPSDTNVYGHHQQQQMPVSDYPERPGQPECSYFMKTGDCKYRSSCKFHHPKSRVARTTPSVLSDKGLPLRPDQNICSHYSRYGICKYGPACKYDHPVNYNNSGGEGGYRSDGRPLIQQSV